MKVKLSNSKLVGDIQLLGTISQKQLPVKVSYAIAKNIGKINNELEVYNEERRKLMNKYGKKDSKGELITDKNGQVQFNDKESWEKDITDLLSIENEIDIHLFSVNELHGFTISPAEMQAIEYMIDESK